MARTHVVASLQVPEGMRAKKNQESISPEQKPAKHKKNMITYLGKGSESCSNSNILGVCVRSQDLRPSFMAA